MLGINRRNLDLVFADYRPGKFRILDDKLETKRIMKDAGVDVPRTVDVITDPGDLDRLEEILAVAPDVVVKPAHGWGGRGILVLRRDGDRWRGPGGVHLDVAAIRTHVADVLAGIHSLDEEADQAILEERIEAHGFYRELTEAGLSDLRVVVEKGEPLQAMCRVPTEQSDGKANLHGGGLGLGIDLANGLVTSAIQGDRRITHHPDTGARLVGETLPAWDRCLSLAVTAAAAVPIDYVGVDIVVDVERGPLVLEVNARPGLAIQLANESPQRVTTRTVMSRPDRFTFGVTWVVLASLALFPFAFEWWQDRGKDPLEVRVGTGEDTHEVEGFEVANPIAGIEMVDDEIPLAATHEVFATARQAADAGRTDDALRLYRSVLADSTLAPFALNNMAVLARRAGQDSLALRHLEEAVTRFPVYHRGHYNLGLVLLSLGRDVDAETSFRTALGIKPGHDRSWEALGNLFYERGEFAAAADAYESVVRYDPGARSARLRLGLSYRLLGDLAAAEERLSELANLDAGSEPAAYWLARTMRERALADPTPDWGPVQAHLPVLKVFYGRSPRCRSEGAAMAYAVGDHVAAYRGFRRLARSDYRPRGHARAAAVSALEIGLWSEAMEHAASSRKQDSAAAARLEFLGRLGRVIDGTLEGDFDPAAGATAAHRLVAGAVAGDAWLVERSLADMADDAHSPWIRWMAGGEVPVPPLDFGGDVWGGSDVGAAAEPDAPIPLGLAFHATIAVAEARGDVTVAAWARSALREARPGFLPVLRKDFVRARATGDDDSAYRLGQDIAETRLDDPDLLLEIADLDLDHGDPAKARRLLKRVPRAYRESAAGRVIQARLMVDEGDARKAVGILKEVLGSNPGAIDARCALAGALVAAGDDEAAVGELRKVLFEEPGRLDARRLLAERLQHQRDDGEAARAWGQYLRLAPEDLGARFSHGLSLQRAKRYTDAVIAYDKLLDRDPQRSKAWFNRSLALEKLDRLAEARSGYEQVLVLDPGHEASLGKLATLKGGP